MEILTLSIVAIVVMTALGYYFGSREKKEYVQEMKAAYEKQLEEMRASYEKQLQQTKEAHDVQIATLKEMNEEQVKSQLELIREQMQTTSEKVLKSRQEELGERNKEQVSKIIDPLQKSLKDMQEAFNRNKEQQAEALTRLDETIKINMQKSAARRVNSMTPRRRCVTKAVKVLKAMTEKVLFLTSSCISPTTVM